MLGFQLPHRLSLSNLHNSAGGGRQADLVRVHCRLCTERSSGCADGFLLECAGKEANKGKGKARGEGSCCGYIWQIDLDCYPQRKESYHSQTRISLCFVLFLRGCSTPAICSCSLINAVLQELHVDFIWRYMQLRLMILARSQGSHLREKYLAKDHG